MKKLATKHVEAIHRRSPWLVGAYLIVIGVSLAGSNVLMIHLMDKFFGKLFIGGFAISMVGIWVMMTGRISRRDDPAPMWWQVGALLFTVLGLTSGFFLSELLSK